MLNVALVAVIWLVLGVVVGLAFGAAESLGGKREVLAVLKRRWQPMALLLAVLLLGGCITSDYTRAHEARRQDPIFMQAYNACGDETALLGLIPDLGTTRELSFFRCMERAGWVMPPRWNRTPAALGLYERRP